MIDEATLKEVEEMCISEEHDEYYIVKMPKKEVPHFLRGVSVKPLALAMGSISSKKDF